MSSDAELRIRQAFEAMCAPARVPVELANRVRASARRRKRVSMSSLATATAALTMIAGTAFSVWQHDAARHNRLGEPNIPVSVSYEGLAVSGDYLYLATGGDQSADLTAYNRMTGQAIGSVHVPAAVQRLTVGPGGLVWLTFDSNAAGRQTGGLFLLSPDLSLLSTAGAAISADLAGVVPIGRTSALVAAPGRLAELRMPAPGQHGSGTLQTISTAAQPHGLPAVGYAPLADSIAVFQQNVAAQLTRVVIAGATGPAYQPAGLDIEAMTAEAGGIWVATSPQPTGPLYGGLVRLDGQLQAQTPRSIATNPDLRFAIGLAAYHDIVWVITDSLTRPLFCFRFDPATGAGPVTFVPTRRPPATVAATATTVYVGDSIGVTSYRVPQACR